MPVATTVLRVLGRTQIILIMLLPSAFAAEETVRFANNSLVGTLVTASPSRHAVILCHGLLWHRQRSTLSGLAEAVALETGVAVLRFDFLGNGDSDGLFDYGYAGETDQIETAAKFLRDRGYTVSGVIGHSKAAAEVLMYRAKYAPSGPFLVVPVCGRFHIPECPVDRFRPEQWMSVGLDPALGELGPRGPADPGWFEWGARPGRETVITAGMFHERAAIDMEAALDGAMQPDTDIVFIHTTDDEAVPVKDLAVFADAARCIAALRPSGSVHVHEVDIPGAMHGFTTMESKAMLNGLVVDAVKRLLSECSVEFLLNAGREMATS